MRALSGGGQFLKSIFRHPRVLRPITKKKMSFSQIVWSFIFFLQKIKKFCISRVLAAFWKKHPPNRKFLALKYTQIWPRKPVIVFFKNNFRNFGRMDLIFFLKNHKLLFRKKKKIKLGPSDQYRRSYVENGEKCYHRYLWRPVASCSVL